MRGVSLREWRGPYLLPAVVFLVLLLMVLGLSRNRLPSFVEAHPALLPAFATGVFALWGILTGSLWFEHTMLRRTWRQRTQRIVGLRQVSDESLLLRLGSRLPRPWMWVASPFFSIGIGRRVEGDWRDAGFRGHPVQAFYWLLGFGGGGFWLGNRIGGMILALGLGLLLPLFPRKFIASRAQSQRRKLGEQLPQALDSLASGLAAGLSFQQAVEFAARELPDPVAGSLARLGRRLTLGYPVEEALSRLQTEESEEALALVVEGIVLQRRFGGDLVSMLEGTADILRERIELQREVRAVTAQGRLSGWVVAALVPVSAGFLLALNPQYIDVMFETLIGQVILVFALLLQLAGWAIISRLIRIHY